MARTMCPRIAIIVGGAPFNAELARGIGADAYAENAVTAPDETRKLVLSFHSDEKLINGGQ
jgi:methanogenic corrinoid protein MtbC1